MEPWKEVCIYVSVYATLREFRLMDPFLTDYLTHLPENYSIETIGREVYPVGSYVNVLFVVIIFLVTDYLRYKPIMILSGLSSIISYSLLLGSPSLIALKASQIFQMFFKAAEVAYLTYMFASIKDKNQYQIATSRVRTSVMIGKFSCGILAEVLKSYSSVSYTLILYLSILGMALTTIWSFIMPSVKFSLYFYKEKPVVHEIVIDNREIVRTKIIDSINVDLGMANIKKNYIKMKCTEVVQKLWTDFKVAYEDPNVFKWSVWWSLSLCGYVLVSQYIQLLWQEIIIQHDKGSTLRNGAVESLATLFSAVAAYAIGSLDNDWDKNGELIMAVVSIGLGVMISALAYAKSLMVSYIYYVVFYSTFQTMLTISSVEVAKFLKRDCYALVFGFNKCITNILITILTVVIVRDSFFSIGIQEKFFIYGLYFVFLGCLFLIMYFMSFWRL